MSYSQEELHSLGHEPRPDRALRPGEYEQWIKTVSRPWTVVSSKHARRNWENGNKKRCSPTYPDSSASFINLDSGNWSGYALTNAYCGDPVRQRQPQSIMSNPVWGYVTGQWDVPSVDNLRDPLNPYETTYQKHAFSQWVGLGGTASGCFNGSSTDALPQAGVDFYDMCNSVKGCTTFILEAWTEYCPNDLQTVFSVGIGHHITASVLISDAQGRRQKQGSYAVIIIRDWTSGRVNNYQTPVPLPSGTQFQGTSAEWIVERIGSLSWNSCNQYLYDLANFGNATFTYTFAQADDDRGYCPPEISFGSRNAISENYAMSLLTCSNATLASATPGCAQSHGATLNVGWRGWR